MKAQILYQSGANIAFEYFEGKDISIIEHLDSYLIKVIIDNKMVFAVSPNHFISFKFI
jgi:hypothetical protein